MANSELPRKENKRGGPGWWMDLDGAWRSPSEWPEDTPPLDGWQRASDGTWHAPTLTANDFDHESKRSPIAVAERTAAIDSDAPRRSRQATADRRAMLTVAGALGAAALLLAVALVLITQAGAEDPVQAKDSAGTVIFAAETDEVRMERRRAEAALAPAAAATQLDALATRTGDDPTGFDALSWVAQRTDCLDIAEQVLVARSERPVVWADQLECVPDTGRWSDRYLDTTITRTLDAEVTPLIPTAIAYSSGGDQWTDATRQAYLTDTWHPATLQIVAAGAGHNPRSQDPSTWKPSNRALWCAYAVDWVAVKTRWELSVTASERSALLEMLETCASPTSDGADPMSMVIDPLGAPAIERIIGNS